MAKGVFIRDMEMPRSCYDNCEFFDDSLCLCERDNSIRVEYDFRPKDCPLIECVLVAVRG